MQFVRASTDTYLFAGLEVEKGAGIDLRPLALPLLLCCLIFWWPF